MALVRACGKSEISAGKLKFVKAAGKDIVIASVNGKLYAMDNWCTHEQGNLSEGQLRGNVLTCPDHGAQFDVTTGKVVLGPDGEKPDTITHEKVYKVIVEGNDAFIEIS